MLSVKFHLLEGVHILNARLALGALNEPLDRAEPLMAILPYLDSKAAIMKK